MSFIDLYERDQRDTMAVQPTEQTQLPATFSDAFHASWSNAYLFGQSIASHNAKEAAIVDYVENLNKRTGEKYDPLLPDGGLDVEGLKSHVDKMRAARPDLNIQPLTDGDLDAMAVKKAERARADYQDMAKREKASGGGFGFALGSMAGAATDPINLLALPVAPVEGLGLLATALRWAAIGGTAQLGIELAGDAFREKVQPGYGESGEPLWNVAEAAGGAAVLGGGMKFLGNAWTRFKTGTWPQSVRDAGNIAESEANVLNTNILPGAEGEVAHRQALVKAMDDLVAGRSVDVSEQITPQLGSAWDEHVSTLMGSRDGAVTAQAEAKAGRAAAAQSGELPFEPTAQEAVADMHLGTLADDVQGMARLSGHDMPREEATALAARVAKAPEDEARQILQEAALRPQTLADTLPSATAAAKERRDAERYSTRGGTRHGLRSEAMEVYRQQVADNALAAEHSPKRLEELRTGPELDDTILRDLDRLRAEKGDMEIPVGETIGPSGERMVQTRKIESVLDEADQRLKAAKEIEACAGPQPEVQE